MSGPVKLKTKQIMAFSSPILLMHAPNPEPLNEQIIQDAQVLREQSPGMTRSNRQGWHSETDLFRRKEPGLSKLSQFIQHAIYSGTKTIAPDFDFLKYRLVVNGWININPTHGYNVPHRHTGFMWSGCYYVNVPEVKEGQTRNSGGIEFLSPVTLPMEYTTFDAMCYKEKITMLPKAGDILLFPSYLTHWVFPNESDEERMTIAFNASYVEKKKPD